MRYFLLAFCLVTTNYLQAQIKKKVLFIGNSYTSANNLPQMIANIAISLGDTLVYDSSTPGGYTFEQHSTNATTITKINSAAWDFVVLQEQSQRPAFSPEQVQVEVYPYADSLNRAIKENNNCTKVLFYMTWGRKNGDAANCPYYPPICTYVGMQLRLRESYLEMAETNQAEVAAVGAAWKYTRENNPEIELYSSDESHPNLAGSYLAACVFYSSLFHKSCIGAGIPLNMDSTTAWAIQQNAGNIVFDSLTSWRIDTTKIKAGFSFSTNNLSVQFLNESENATNYLWDFGDGTTSIETYPEHSFAAIGNYTIKLIASDSCNADSLISQVLITTTHINHTNKNDFILIPNPFMDEIKIHCANREFISKIELYSVTGTKISEFKPNETGKLPGQAGVYFAKVYTNKGFTILKLVKPN